MTLLKRVKRLPEGFVWGAATAAYQVEGSTGKDGMGKTMWDDFLVSKGRFLPDPASDFYHRYPEDIRLAAEHGIKALRISISWARVFPNTDGDPNPVGVKYYHELFAECRKHGIEPYVTLHHLDSPIGMFSRGDWLNRANIDSFVNYARFCFEEFTEVSQWFTINEPISLAFFQYVVAEFPPADLFNFSSSFQAMHNMALAHARVVKAFKEGGHRGRIGVIHALKPVYPIVDTPDNRHAAELWDAYLNRFLLDLTFFGKLTDRTSALIEEICGVQEASFSVEDGDYDEMQAAVGLNDYLGINYYQPQFVQAYAGENRSKYNATGEKGTTTLRMKGIAELVKNPDVPTTDWDWNVYPQGLYDILRQVDANYPAHPTIYITENGLGSKDVLDAAGDFVDDDDRIDFIDQHLDALLKAREDGVDVRGYFVWSLQDQFSWSNGYNKRYGLFYIDFETQRRVIKKSALWSKEIASTID